MLAKDLVFAIALDAFGRPAPGDDVASCVQQDDAVIPNALDQAAEQVIRFALLAFAWLLCVRFIFHGSPAILTGFVPWAKLFVRRSAFCQRWWHRSQQSLNCVARCVKLLRTPRGSNFCPLRQAQQLGF